MTFEACDLVNGKESVWFKSVNVQSVDDQGPTGKVRICYHPSVGNMIRSGFTVKNIFN